MNRFERKARPLSSFLLAGIATAAMLALAPSSASAQAYSVSLQPHTFQALPISGGDPMTQYPYPQFGGTGYGAYELAINMPFSVPFYGQNYSLVTVLGNGTVMFGPGTFGSSTSASNMDKRQIPSTTGLRHNFVAVWQDQVTCQVSGSEGGNLITQYLGPSGSRRLVIQWTNCRRYASSGTFTAQLWLTENSSTIEVHYGSLGTGTQSWVAGMGVENNNGTDGTPGLGLNGTVCNPSCTPANFPAGHRLVYSMGPSLSVTAVRTPTEAYAGIGLPVSVDVKNTGSDAATDFTVQLWLNTTPSRTGAIPLGSPAPVRQTANASSTVTFNMRPTIPLSVNQGTYYIIAEADPDHAVPVGNRNGTTGSSPAVSIGIPAPNLVALDVEVPAQIQPGRTFDLTWTASNIGTSPAYHAPYQVVLSASDTPSASSRVLDIMGSDGRPTRRRHVDIAEMIDPPVANRVYADVPLVERVILPADVPAGRYWIGVRMDPDAEVFEHDRSDNTGVSNATVASTPTSLGIITAQTLPSAEANSRYSIALQAVGGDGSYFWKLGPGSILPPGLHLEELPAGAREAGLPFVTYLTGTPTRIGEYDFTLEVSSGTLTKSTSFHLPVVPQMLQLTIQTRDVPSAWFEAEFRFALLADGGVPPYVWSIATGKLPGGLKFGSDGVIVGRPLQSGEFPLTFRVTDDRGVSTTQETILGVLDPDDTVKCGTDSIGPFRLGETVDVYFQAGGGSTQDWTTNSIYYLSTVEGEEAGFRGNGSPPGLTLESTGRVRGKPTRAGAYDWTVSVRTSLGGTGTLCPVRVEVLRDRNLAISTLDLPTAVVGVPYDARLEASGGEGDLQWSLLHRTEKLPAGLTLTSDGLITGVPTGEDLNGEKAGSFSFLVRAVDSYNRVGTAPLSITLLATPPGPGPADDEKKETSCQTVGADPSLLAVAAALGLATLRRRRS